MLHKFSVEPIGYAYGAKVKIDDKDIKCFGYTLRHFVDEVPKVEIIINALPNIENDVVINVGNKEEIARLMNREEFVEFCKIWGEVHNE